MSDVSANPDSHDVMIGEEAAAALVAAARGAAAHAYAPYSHFHVGAALLLEDGRVLTAANVENASYGLSLCAETIALAKAANEGQLGHVRAMAITAQSALPAPALDGDTVSDAPDAPPVTPCGRCRQIMAEAAMLSGRDIAVYCASLTEIRAFRLSELLPHAFLLDKNVETAPKSDRNRP